MLTLAIAHNIFLNKGEIEALINRESVECLGASVPVWFLRGNTSEPAKEIFCKYKLTNIADDYPVTILAKGYQINLPQVIFQIGKPENWSKMSQEEKSVWRTTHPLQISADDLADLGNDMLNFKKYSKITENNKRLNIIHAISVGTIELLEKSLSI